jgi:hypothetical protein
MGVTQWYLRITPAEFARLRNDREFGDHLLGRDLDEDDGALDAYHDALETGGRHLDIDKTWQAIHFALTGEKAYLGGSCLRTPLHHLVMGGADTEYEAGYGMVRFLAPDMVREIARALEPISPEELRSRLDAEAFTREEIYPGPPFTASGLEHWLIEPYSELRQFFIEAATAGDVVLLASS